VCCSVLQCVAACCSVLQCVAVCCNVLQRSVRRQCPALTDRCNTLQHTATYCNALQHTATHCNRRQCPALAGRAGFGASEMWLQCVAVRCSVLQCVTVCCIVLHCVAVCCNVLQSSVLQCVAVCCSDYGEDNARLFLDVLDPVRSE